MSKYRIVKVGLYYTVERWELDQLLTYKSNMSNIMRGHRSNIRDIYNWVPVDANTFVESLNAVGIRVPEGIQLCCRYGDNNQREFKYHQTIDSANNLVELLKEYKDGGIYTDIRQFLPYREDTVSTPYLLETRKETKNV